MVWKLSLNKTVEKFNAIWVFEWLTVLRAQLLIFSQVMISGSCNQAPRLSLWSLGSLLEILTSLSLCPLPPTPRSHSSMLSLSLSKLMEKSFFKKVNAINWNS